MLLSMDLPNTISILSLFIFIYLLSVWDIMGEAPMEGSVLSFLKAE
jgi:hypothetical protein